MFAHLISIDLIYAYEQMCVCAVVVADSNCKKAMSIDLTIVEVFLHA